MSAQGKQPAVSIPSVKDATGATFGVAALDREPWAFVKPLVCAKCGTKVKAVHGDPTLKEDGTPKRRHYYSLHDRRTDDHRPGCLYAFDRRVGEIVQEFKHDVERDSDIVTLLLRTQQPPRDPADGDPPANTTRRTEITTPSDWELLPATVQAAASIARLLRAFNNDPAAAARFRARWQGHDIAWDDFCFDADTRAVDALAVARGAESPHPIAVHGTVTRSPSQSKKQTSWVIYFTRADQPTLVSLRAFNRARTFIDYPPGAHVLGYGLWDQFTRDGSGAVELSLWCENSTATTAIRPD